MNRNTPYFSKETRQKAVALVHQYRDDYPSLWATCSAVSPAIGCAPSTLMAWVGKENKATNPLHPEGQQSARDVAVKVKDLETKVRALEKSNTLLKKVCELLIGQYTPGQI